MPKISVIMGIFNCAETLETAIDSIIKQSYTDWQMIICDDGSTDDSYDIAARYMDKYPDKFILLQNEKNMGLNYTLNRCLDVADSEYIARMDGDDISHSTRFEKEIEFLENNPKYSIVSTPMEYFDDTGVFMTGNEFGEPSIPKMVTGTPFPHAPCMVRKEAYDAVGGYSVDPKLLRIEDWHLWIKMYSQNFRGYILPEPLYQMRDDRNAYKRRKYKYRIYEARLSCIVVKMLKLEKWRYVFALRPLIVGLLPKPIYMYLHRRKTSK